MYSENGPGKSDNERVTSIEGRNYLEADHDDPDAQGQSLINQNNVISKNININISSNDNNRSQSNLSVSPSKSHMNLNLNPNNNNDSFSPSGSDSSSGLGLSLVSSITDSHTGLNSDSSNSLEGSAVPLVALGASATLRNFYLAVFWFGWSFLWLPLLVVIIPYQVKSLAGEDDKGSALGQSMLMGSAVSLVAGPLFGSFSDSCTFRIGRRRPFMITGTIIATIALIFMAFSWSIDSFGFFFLILSLGNNMILSPYSALVPDTIEASQRGTASGWLGFMSMLGYLCGGFVSWSVDSIGIILAYFILIFIHGASMAVTCYFIEEIPITDETCLAPRSVSDRFRSIVRPMLNVDFRILFFTRFLMQMGIVTVQQFLLFYLSDAVQNFSIDGQIVANSPQQAASILFVPILVGSIVSSLLAGIISDYMNGKRKQIVYLSGILMTITTFSFGLTRSYTVVMILGFLFGIGFGAFSTMDWALATDLLPFPPEYAKDMGIWSLALVLPQVVAAPIGGWLLRYFQKVGPSFQLGYVAIFSVAAAYTAAGTYFVKFIQGIH